MEPLDDLADAAFWGDLPRVDSLIAKVKDINLRGRNWSPLHAAIENENYEIIFRLIEAGADLEQQNNEMTALAHAVDIAIDGTRQAGKRDEEVPTKIVALIMRRGAETAPGVEMAQDYGCSPMVEFILRNKEECEQVARHKR